MALLLFACSGTESDEQTRPEVEGRGLRSIWVEYKELTTGFSRPDRNLTVDEAWVDEATELLAKLPGIKKEYEEAPNVSGFEEEQALLVNIVTEYQAYLTLRIDGEVNQDDDIVRASTDQLRKVSALVVELTELLETDSSSDAGDDGSSSTAREEEPSNDDNAANSRLYSSQTFFTLEEGDCYIDYNEAGYDYYITACDDAEMRVLEIVTARDAVTSAAEATEVGREMCPSGAIFLWGDGEKRIICRERLSN